MTTMPANYFQRFDASKEYEEQLFIAGRGLQSAELNDLQKASANRLRGIADVLFKDGAIVRDASIIVNESTGVTQCQSGAVYIGGAVRGVAPATFTLPVSGVHSVGVRLVESVVTALTDLALRDPAPGTRNYDEEGAERLKINSQWGWSGDGATGAFFPVYSVVDGVVGAKEPPPNLDFLTQAMARYDRDSSGGSYVVSGMAVKQLSDVSGVQVYSLAEGRARVFGYGIEFPAARRITHAAVPDLLTITNEPHMSTTDTAQRVNFGRVPGTAISAVSITAEKTVTLIHGVVTGTNDPLPDTSVLSIIEVKQGVTTYVATTNYLLTAGGVNWSPAGAEPAPGSSYTVKYRYITSVTPTAIDVSGFTVTGAINGTLILVTYSQMLQRYDRLCLNAEGLPVWIIGVGAAFNPQVPPVPADLLPLASVTQTWSASRSVSNDGVRLVPMPVLAGIDSRFDLIMQLIAQQRLESNIHTREGGTKKGLFTDPFMDDSQRDAGVAQTAAVVSGELVLPISSTVSQLGSDVLVPTALLSTSVISLAQILRTGSMKINPYMAFALAQAGVTLTPSVDRWTVVEDSWSSSIALRWRRGPNVSRNRNRRLNSLISSDISTVETLRQISVAYVLTGFGAGEALSTITFDGVSVSNGGAVANGSGVVSGSFMVPSGVPSGSKTVVFTGAGGATGEATYSGQGTLERRAWQQQATDDGRRWQSPPRPRPISRVRIDPLAQTFVMADGTQVAGVDLWFSVAPTTLAQIQIRETTAGFPNQNIVAERTVPPGGVLVGGVSTRITFESPVTLMAGVEYAIVVLCNDATGALSIAELGKFDPTAQQWITSQPYTVGVLLSSSNASTWTAHQDRDMAFRILSSSYSPTTRSVALGNVAVTGATDLLLMAFAELPASTTNIDYTLTLPDASTLRVADGQAVQLATAITGNVGITANLSGSEGFSPVLHPNGQLVSGVVSASADYVSRAIPGGSAVTIKVIYEAVVPSGAGVAVSYKGPDVGDTWQAIGSPTTLNVDDGFVEFTHVATGVNELTAQIKLVLSGTSAARPRVRDLRVIVL